MLHRKTRASECGTEVVHHSHRIDNDIYSTIATATRNRGKAIGTSSAPTYDPEPATVTEDEEMSKEKEIDKLMALISLSFKKIYKPTNNNLRTSSNTSRANQDNSPRINRGTGYDNQRAVNVVGARENVGTPVVQKSGIQCYNCKEYGHVSRESRVQLNAEQADWKDDTDDESEEPPNFMHCCYNDNLALMLAPDSDETIRLDKECRSKLSDLIKPFDYDQLNNLYDLFVPQREKSAEQHYFPKTSKMSHTSSNKEFSK
ncbi:integrase, catalytic region, zinc finger, CCHC-type containing protein [Tanacetum coccineum]